MNPQVIETRATKNWLDEEGSLHMLGLPVDEFTLADAQETEAIAWLKQYQ